MSSGDVDNSVTSDNETLKEDISNNSNNTSTSAITVTKTVSFPIPPSQCHCELSERLERDRLLIKEATTGYTENGQEIGSFVTYVIEFGVIDEGGSFKVLN